MRWDWKAKIPLVMFRNIGKDISPCSYFPPENKEEGTFAE
jgi:hypothetical protein